MTVKDLREYLSNTPDDAVVFLECDHGQNKERADSFVESRSPIDFRDPDAMIFEWDNWTEVYDEDYVENYDEGRKVTAILISY